MRSVLALLRTAWLSATSYRVATVLSLASVVASVIPIFFIARAVQDVAAESIRVESTSYFAFVVVGVAAIYVVSAAVGAIPSAIAGGIGNGTFEALLGTRTPLPLLLIGLGAYPVAQALLRAAVLLLGGLLLGMSLAWPMLLPVAGITLLVLLAYTGIGLIAAAALLMFRTSGPLPTAVIALSGLLGGAYYSTAAVPGWLQVLTDWVPLTYALRAARMLLLGGAPLAEVRQDVVVLAIFAVTSLAVGALAFGFGLRRARRNGTLSQY